MITVVMISVLNLFALPFYFFTRDKMDIAIRPMLMFFGFVNLLFVGLWLISGLSVEDMLINWTQWFTQHIRNWYAFSILVSALFVCILLPFLYKQIQDLPHEDRRYYVFVFSGLLIITGLIWVVFGFSSYPHWELWAVRNYFTIGDRNLDLEIISRLSILIPHTALHFLDPNGFVAYNVAHFLLTWLRGVFVFIVLRQFGINNLIVYTCVALAMFYPTGTIAMSLRNITVLMSNVLFLGTVTVFIVFYKRPTRLNLAMFIIAMFMSVTFNEYYFLLMLAFPILLFHFDKGLNRKLLTTTIIWWALPLAYLGYYYLIAQVGNVYGLRRVPQLSESSVFESLADVLGKVVDVISQTYVEIFVNGWGYALRLDDTTFLILFVTLLAVCLYLVLGKYVIRIDRNNVENKRAPSFFQLIVVSLIIIVLTSAVFGVFIRSETQWRVYGLSSIGAALILSTTLFNLCRSRVRQFDYRIIYLIVMAICFAFAYKQSFQQYERYWTISQNNKIFLSFLDEIQVESLDSKWIFFTDLPSQEFLDAVGDLRFRDVRAIALNSLLRMRQPRHVVNLHICYMEKLDCQFKDEFLEIPQRGDEVIEIPYDEIVLFWIDSDLKVSLLEELPTPPQLTINSELYQPFQYVIQK